MKAVKIGDLLPGIIDKVSYRVAIRTQHQRAVLSAMSDYYRSKSKRKAPAASRHHNLGDTGKGQGRAYCISLMSRM